MCSFEWSAVIWLKENSNLKFVLFYAYFFFIIKTDYDIILICFLFNKIRLLKFPINNYWKKISLDPEPKNKSIPKILFFSTFQQ